MLKFAMPIAKVLRRFRRLEITHLYVILFDLIVRLDGVGRLGQCMRRNVIRATRGTGLDAEGFLHLPENAGVLEDLRETGHADDHEATRHFGEGPENHGSDVVDRIGRIAVLDRNA